MATRFETRSSRGPALVFLEVTAVPLVLVAPVAAILILGLGWDPSEQLTRGVLYAWLFLVCVAIGRWKFSLSGIGLTRMNLGRGFAYASIILVVGLIFLFALQPPEGLADVSPAIWRPVLFYLAVALAEEVWFRGLMFRALCAWRGALLGVFGSALLFGVMHLPTHGWQGLLYSLSIGLPYAVVRLRAGNIWGLIAVHWLTNLTDTFIRLHAISLDMARITLLHILVFSGVSVLILLVDKWLHRKALVSL